MATLLAGILILIAGAKTKRKWLMVLSAIPIIAALSQIGILFIMFLEILQRGRFLLHFCIFIQ